MALTAKCTAEDIIQFRRKLGLNQTEFWRPIGITQSGGSRYESGRAIPQSVRTLLVVAYGTKSASETVVKYLRSRQPLRKR